MPQTQDPNLPHPKHDPLYYHPSRDPELHPELYSPAPILTKPMSAGLFSKAPEKPLVHSYNLRPRPAK